MAKETERGHHAQLKVWRNTLARDDHAPITDELFGLSRQRLSERMAASKAEGRMSTRGQRNNADLTSKIDKNWSSAKPFHQPHERWTLHLRNFFEVFSCQTKEKLQNYTYLHSPNGLGGLKPPPKQVWRDSKLHSPSD
jgi:hypothetical protein